MSLQIYINGTYYDKENAKISVYDHGLLYGDGVFEGMRAYSGKVFKLREHMDRLYESARTICLQIPISKSQLEDDVNATLQKNALTDAYIRLVVTRGAGSLITASTIRNHPAALSPRVKSLNYLNNIMAKIEGLQAGCVEAVMLNHKGEVAECTGDNIFIIKRGILLTPPKDAGILEGITRNAILELAGKLNIPAHEQTMTRHDLLVADECFLTGSAAEVIPVVSIDSRTIGDGTVGPVTTRLIAEFKKMVHGIA
jgi:branched-chain amino acid aminotransferase